MAARPPKFRSGLRTKNKYPKELNPFGSDTSISAGIKTSEFDFPPDLNPFSEEYNDEQASLSEGDTNRNDIKQCDNEHSSFESYKMPTARFVLKETKGMFIVALQSWELVTGLTSS